VPPPHARRRPGSLRIRREAGLRPGGGGGKSASGSGAGPRWLVPLLAIVLGAFALSAGWQWWLDRQAPAPAQAERHAPAATPKGISSAARVEVLNGSGEPGAAAKLASYLREGGFNVVQVGSADRFDYGRTIVIGRTDDPRSARAVSAYLGRVTKILQRARSEADVTVIVGRDRGRLPWGEGRPARGKG
jgi:hypothetical protein